MKCLKFGRFRGSPLILCSAGAGGWGGGEGKEFFFFPSNSQITNKTPISFLSRRQAINQNEEIILSQGWDSDSLLILDLAGIRKLNLEITVNSKKTQDIYYIDSSISVVYYCLVTLLMTDFKVSFLHENGAVILWHCIHMSNCLGLWTIRNLWSLAVTYYFWGRIDQFMIIKLSDLLFKCISMPFIKKMYQNVFILHIKDICRQICI